jgi:hypothetical protein
MTIIARVIENVAAALVEDELADDGPGFTPHKLLRS